MENNLTQNIQNQVAVCNGWICSTVWMWVLDTNTKIGRKCWMGVTHDISDVHLTLAGRTMWLMKNCMITFQRSHKNPEMETKSSGPLLLTQRKSSSTTHPLEAKAWKEELRLTSTGFCWNTSTRLWNRTGKSRSWYDGPNSVERDHCSG